MIERAIKQSFLSVLEIKDLKYLWLSQIFSQIALNMLTFALVLHIYELTSSALSIALVMMASAIPVALFGPFSGAIADRIDNRKILLYTNVFRFFCGLLMILSHGNVLGLLEIIFLISALSQFFTPAESSSIPLIVPKEKLVAANSVVMITTYATLLIGYSLAGPIMVLVNSKFLFLLCSLLFLIATYLIRQMSRYDNKECKNISLQTLAKDMTDVWKESKDGLKYLLKNKKILSPMIRLTVGWTVLGAFITLLPAYGETVLKIDPKFIGPTVIAPAGLGMIISALLLSRKSKKVTSRVMNNGFMITSFALLLFSFHFAYSGLPFSRIFLFMTVILIGFGSSIIQISAQTILHLNSEEKIRGRVFGFSSMQLRLATTLPAFLVGGISDLTSPLFTMILIALTVFIYSLILIFE